MIIIPSIDIKDGKCVRLKQGDFNESSVYSNAPEEIASKFYAEGARILHVVDLDGAKQGKIIQLDIIKKIKANFPGLVQVGGGIREYSDIDQLNTIKIGRAVIGTRAVADVPKTTKWLKEYGADSIVLALDFKMIDDIPYLAIAGWQQETNQNLWNVLDQYTNIQHVLSTDIGKDGMQNGPNFQFYEEFTARYPNIKLQASGGISSIYDIMKLQEVGMSGAIIGKALYENKISLKEAMLCLK